MKSKVRQIKDTIIETLMVATLVLWIGSFLAVILTAFYDLMYALVGSVVFFVTTGIIHANRDSFRILEEE